MTREQAIHEVAELIWAVGLTATDLQQALAIVKSLPGGAAPACCRKGCRAPVVTIGAHGEHYCARHWREAVTEGQP